MTPSELARIGNQAWNEGVASRRTGRLPRLLGNLPDGVTLLKTSTGGAEFVIAFVRCKADVKTMARSALNAVFDNGLLWFAYPKKSSSLQSDLSRDSGWEPLFEAGFDSVAQISIDETWTGFRFRPKHLVGKRPR